MVSVGAFQCPPAAAAGGGGGAEDGDGSDHGEGRGSREGGRDDHQPGGRPEGLSYHREVETRSSAGLPRTGTSTCSPGAQLFGNPQNYLQTTKLQGLRV